MRPSFDLNVDGWRKEKDRLNIFFNLEKRNYNRKTITELQTDDNEIVKEEDKILKQ